MANLPIPRQDVHNLAEGCAGDPESFQRIASRLLREQKSVAKFLSDNFNTIGPENGQIATYMAAVSLRIFQELGGRMRKIPRREIDSAAMRVHEVVDDILPADSGVPDRVRAIEWRAQPHLLDEILWALFEKKAEDEEEIEIEPNVGTMIFLTLWPLVEAMDATWRPPRGYDATPITDEPFDPETREDLEPTEPMVVEASAE